ncbi:methylmalonyl-CoA mutase metallochaperone MeaB [Leeuwenhoekiella aestuarii]|uniref:Methylmalonyl-CoA mutase metallochaperone MeaB n=1 Tax=Leeuwenhoekiella aestuarii TaxID=2249426 RepID=A0A4Q0NXR1_9FLAO|nr:methylmalonyl Co-A mutase-associated GTPase MeaB [Leeuwenhoekiella aestuarii]RXG16014.1 methylmalonyl-CoA mutase metallochaperone MeaB [Leeuwenhoekiella aestuarii]RXG16708.1 methylmalonyl-CoA mutase metallochaperone MeaB [Leeuwenhoekiella aestuarii]
MKPKKPEHIYSASAKKIIATRKKALQAEDLIQKISCGNTTALSQAITLIESTAVKHQQVAQEVLKGCLPLSGNSVRIGITGVPGVGKSTFIEALGTHCINTGKKLAVLAIDPSSSITHGSILGDKTRMEQLATNPNAFVRPSAAGDSLGGVARKTREAIILCEAAGYEVIFIETVGVGQSETAVHNMTDFFLLLKLAGAGDELQGIKRGIVEMADALIINKADGENLAAAKKAKTAFAKALHLFPAKESSWQPQVALCSALENQGIESIWELIEEYLSTVKANQFFNENRKNQNKYWLQTSIENALKDDFYANTEVQDQLQKLLNDLNAGKITAFQAAQELLKKAK